VKDWKKDRKKKEKEKELKEGKNVSSKTNCKCKIVHALNKLRKIL
jgi:hypothetical protein